MDVESVDANAAAAINSAGALFPSSAVDVETEVPTGRRRRRMKPRGYDDPNAAMNTVVTRCLVGGVLPGTHCLASDIAVARGCLRCEGRRERESAFCEHLLDCIVRVVHSDAFSRTDLAGELNLAESVSQEGQVVPVWEPCGHARHDRGCSAPIGDRDASQLHCRTGRSDRNPPREPHVQPRT